MSAPLCEPPARGSEMGPMTPAAITARLRAAARLADLTIGHRMQNKVGFDRAALTARLRQVEALRRLCRRLARKP